MRVLISGGLGFIGGRIARRLADAGNEVVVGTRRRDRPPVWLPEATMALTDWRDPVALEQACRGIDAVIHAAGMNAEDCATNPVSALEFNGVATTRLVAAASGAGVRRFIYLSTAHVYASPLAGLITEDTCPRNLHPYATSHLAGEHAVLHAAARGGMEGVVLRLSNAYGAPMDRDVPCWTLLVNDLCRQSVETRRMVLRTSGLQPRDFIALSEVCRVIEGQLRRDASFGRAVLNVGSGVSIPVRDMAEFVRARCASVLGFQPELQWAPPLSGEWHEPLTFSTDGLNEQGLAVSADRAGEIDRLLLFCNESFRRSVQ